MTPEELALVSTQTLLDALCDRFESTIFIGHNSHSEKEDSSTYRYGGNLVTMLGLLSRITNKINDEMDEVGHELDPADG